MQNACEFSRVHFLRDQSPTMPGNTTWVHSDGCFNCWAACYAHYQRYLRTTEMSVSILSDKLCSQYITISMHMFRIFCDMLWFGNCLLKTAFAGATGTSDATLQSMCEYVKSIHSVHPQKIHYDTKPCTPNLDHRCKRPWLRSLLF